MKFVRHITVSDRFIAVGNCTSRGDEEVWGHEKLCTACQGIYMLNDECFPAFMNSVICDKQENQCIYDRYTKTGIWPK